ncbi:hypothetical protein QFZ82_005158 [Streptomyces sp. V4I23]|nr:hypothetical protein [Streptomyces sp. V4I23]MDQ1010673.1 hypothetical protein [Streptomyces sp. V4I23]
MSMPPPHHQGFVQQGPTAQHLYQAHTGAGPRGETPCQVCGSLPAVRAVVRGHQGLFLIMRFLRREGVFCRSCGTATYRQMTTDTLWQGWWGFLSLFITPVTVLTNLGPRARFRRLAQPYGGWRPPLDPGKRVLARPPALVVFVPMVLSVSVIAFGIIRAAVSDDGAGRPVIGVGDCVRNLSAWPEQNIQPVDCGSPLAQYRTARIEDCTGDEYLMRVEDAPDAVAMCLRPLRNR